MKLKITDEQLDVVLENISAERKIVKAVIAKVIGIDGIEFNFGTVSSSEYYFDIDNKISGNIEIEDDYYHVNGNNDKGFKFNSSYLVTDGKVIKVGAEVGTDKKLIQAKNKNNS